MYNNEQFVSLLIEVQPRLYGFVLALLGNREDADDVLQQANLVLVRKQADFELGTNFGAWARQVAYHEVQAFRKVRAHDRVFLGDSLVEQLAQVAEPFTDDVASRRSALRHCLNLLTPRRRRLIKDRYSGAKVKEIASRTRRSAGAISQELYRIRAALADCIVRQLVKEHALLDKED